MLCNSKTNNRPDRALQKALLKLAFALILLTLSLIWFFIIPEQQIYSTLTTSIVTIYCLLTAIKTLNAGEAAISYGGFANEIIKNDFKLRRIENPLGESIIENTPAKDTLKGKDVLSFLADNLADGAANKAAFYRLQTAHKNLCSEKVTLSLITKPSHSLIFNDLEYYEISLRPIYLKKPNIFDGAFSIKRIKKETYFYWTLNDITARQNMDRIFKNECNQLHDFLDDLPVGLYNIDKERIISYVNNDLSKILGKSPHEFNGLLLSDFLSDDCKIPLDKEFWFGPAHFKNINGDDIDCYVFQSSYRDKEQPMFRGVVIHDLPTLSELQQQIHQSLDEIKWLFNNSPIGMIFINSQGEIKNSNPKAQELFGVKESFSNIYKALSPENIQLLRQAIEKITADSLNLELKTPERDLNLYINKLNKNSREDGANFIIYVIDNTKQKNLELQFSQAQKMQAVGQLAGGVAHDFNNLLTAIIGFTDLLLQRHGVGDPSFADLIQIKQNSNRATSLVRQLLAFSRKQPLIPKLIDVTDNFADLSQMLKRILGEKIKLVFKHESDLGYVKVDPNQFSQVIINLAVNAKDAMEGTGTLTISTHTYYLPEKFMFGDDTIMPGDFVVIDVTDTGCGIPKENMSRIFDPFFTTKENIVGSGTGLGLAMVYGIVRQTEGFIKVDSTVGKGTIFSIYLPRFEHGPDEDGNHISASPIIKDSSGETILKVQERISAPSNINQKIIMGLNISNTIDRSHTAAGVSGHPARILFVEDEDSVRAFGVRALKKKGYEVVDSNSAENALEILENDNNFDLLLTDMVLPGMSGAQLTNKVKEKLPQISVILASGYSEDIARQEVDNTNDFEFITKPYSLGDLTAKVFDVLNRSHNE